MTCPSGRHTKVKKSKHGEETQNQDRGREDTGRSLMNAWIPPAARFLETKRRRRPEKTNRNKRRRANEVRRVSQLVLCLTALWLAAAVFFGAIQSRKGEWREGGRGGRQGRERRENMYKTNFLASRLLSPLRYLPLSLDRDGKYRTRWRWRVRLPRNAAPGDFGVNNSEGFALGAHMVSFLPAC